MREAFTPVSSIGMSQEHGGLEEQDNQVFDGLEVLVGFDALAEHLDDGVIGVDF